MKRNLLIALLTIITTIGLTAGLVKAGEVLGVDMIHTGSLKVGSQGLGGVTFFNGTIVNETSTNGVDNPVTFGDNVRIDGTIQRGDTAGPGDGYPVKFDDDVEVLGTLTVGGQPVNSGQDFTPQINDLQNQINALGGTVAIHNDQISGTIGTNDEQGVTLSLVADTITVMTDRIIENRDYIVYYDEFFNCLTMFAEITTFIESVDWGFCWNLHVAGKPKPSPLAGSTLGDGFVMLENQSSELQRHITPKTSTVE